MGTKLDIIPVKDWFDFFEDDYLIIAGPCSAESEKQVMDTALEIEKLGRVQAYREGIWKPRTRPESFAGVGSEGLKWLKKVKEETNLLTIVEVATPKHVEECLLAGIDMFWIGARTTPNTFAIQEIADSLKGVDIPVLIKNPVNPETELWVGALERFNNAGIKKLAAIHRGFYPFEKTSFRNIPKWEIPISLKSRFHNLPIFCDPSHISGNVKYLEEIAQKSLDLNMSGLMIETHIDPEHAKSDAEQQVSPKELNTLLDNLVFREAVSDNIDFTNLLEKLREQIDSIDDQMIELLNQRMKIVEQIGKYKKDNNVTILQLRRWEKIISTRTEFAQSLGLSSEFIHKLLQLVHKESIQKQVEIMKLSQERIKEKKKNN